MFGLIRTSPEPYVGPVLTAKRDGTMLIFHRQMAGVLSPKLLGQREIVDFTHAFIESAGVPKFLINIFFQSEDLLFSYALLVDNEDKRIGDAAIMKVINQEEQEKWRKYREVYETSLQEVFSAVMDYANNEIANMQNTIPDFSRSALYSFDPQIVLGLLCPTMLGLMLTEYQDLMPFHMKLLALHSFYSLVGLSQLNILKAEVQLSTNKFLRGVTNALVDAEKKQAENKEP